MAKLGSQFIGGKCGLAGEQQRKEIIHDLDCVLDCSNSGSRSNVRGLMFLQHYGWKCPFICQLQVPGATLHCPCKQSRLSPNGISTADHLNAHLLSTCCTTYHLTSMFVFIILNVLSKGHVLSEGRSPVCQTETKKWQAESPHGGWMLARACQTRVSCAVSVYSKCRLSEPQPGLHCVKSGGVTIGTLQRCRAS